MQRNEDLRPENSKLNRFTSWMMSWWEFAKCPYFFRKLFSRQVSQNLFFDIKTSYFWAAAISEKFVYFCWSFSCFAVRWQHLLFWLSEHFQKCSTFEKKVVFFNFNICAGACWGCHLYHEKEREKLKLVIEVCLLPSTPEDVKIASEVYFYFAKWTWNFQCRVSKLKIEKIILGLFFVQNQCQTSISIGLKLLIMIFVSNSVTKWNN